MKAPQVWALTLLALGCPKPDDSAPPADSRPPEETAPPQETAPPEETSPPDDTAPEERWTGTAEVVVTDPAGLPLEGAYAMLGGADRDAWALTDGEGRATVEVGDDGVSDRWVLAGMEGWISSGADIHDINGPSGILNIVLQPLPPAEDDNADYHFQPGGTSMSMDTTDCGHCHPTKADDWVDSPHHRSASNSHTWDLYTGGTAVDAATCASLGGFMATGQEPGVEGGTLERCYTGVGVLPFLHDDCGQQGDLACDHPDQAEALEAYGSCGDCHAPAVDRHPGGRIDLARATGVAFDEGVTCDLCHKTRAVVAGGAPGRDGAIQLQRPSEETMVVSQEFDPITFGPYPDVVVAIMKGSYDPGMREAAWCSSCHEYRRGSLRDDQPVDPARWPDGLPVNETWSECEAGPCSDETTCASCHMEVLYEESSTYDISERGLSPSIDQGWLRSAGEVVHHDFEWFAKDEIFGLSVSLEGADEVVEAAVRVNNWRGGHALPTGHPMRQLIVLVEATDQDGQPVPATGGQAVPDVGGYRATGIYGSHFTASGNRLDFQELPLPAASAVRFVRPTGTWEDYAGPGTASFVGASAQDKGLPITAVLGETAISTIDDGVVTLAAEPPALAPGDIAYLVDGADAAGLPGWLFAKVMTSVDGQRGVAHYRAVDIASDNRLAFGGSSTSTHSFPTPAEGGSLTVRARLLTRDYAATVANSYGWDTADEQVQEASATIPAD
jgi:hypothetical protein